MNCVQLDIGPFLQEKSLLVLTSYFIAFQAVWGLLTAEAMEDV